MDQIPPYKNYLSLGCSAHLGYRERFWPQHLTMALSFKYFISLTLFLGLFLISTAHGNTIPSTGDIDASNSTLDKRDDKVKLRILPLGASITWGLLSETHNGYRKPLRDQLRWKGYEVDMVGTRSNGEMKDKVCVPSSFDKLISSAHAIILFGV